jgi:transcription elongation GreA/GreB family factor
MSVRDEPVGTRAERADAFALRCATCEATLGESQVGAVGMPFGAIGWPIDVRAMKHLLARIERMAGDRRIGDDSDGQRRLDALREQCGASSVTFDPEVAAIGRRVTVQDEHARTKSFWLALPGDEHATANTVSVAAPAGRSVAGARVGDVVYLDLEGRRRWAVVMGVA